jgi:hypothetical protein
MIYDKDEIEASCLFCPYAIDKKPWELFSLTNDRQGLL